MSAATAAATPTNASWPAFPGDKEVPVAPLATVDLGRLIARDAVEVGKLLNVCHTHGFFYLDLQTSEQGRQILADEQGLLRFMERYFDQPLETKMLDDRKVHTHGFKPVGTFSGTKNGTKDRVNHQVARTEMVEKSPKLPEDVKKQEALFDSFISLSHFITHTLLECLSDALGLVGPARLEQFHRDGEETNTTLVMLHYPPTGDTNDSIGHNKHTDIGSITLLFSEQWGLQVWSPETDSWAFIQPRPHGHATINVGDSLRFLSGKQFYSCLHRVIPPAGERQVEDRYSIAYFLRPENNAVYEDPSGKKVTARVWHDDKYVMFGEPHVKQEASPMLTGGMEPILGSREIVVN